MGKNVTVPVPLLFVTPSLYREPPAVFVLCILKGWLNAIFLNEYFTPRVKYKVGLLTLLGKKLLPGSLKV